jgi:hypothetical protein
LPRFVVARSPQAVVPIAEITNFFLLPPTFTVVAVHTRFLEFHFLFSSDSRTDTANSGEGIVATLATPISTLTAPAVVDAAAAAAAQTARVPESANSSTNSILTANSSTVVGGGDVASADAQSASGSSEPIATPRSTGASAHRRSESAGSASPARGSSLPRSTLRACAVCFALARLRRGALSPCPASLGCCFYSRARWLTASCFPRCVFARTVHELMRSRIDEQPESALSPECAAAEACALLAEMHLRASDRVLARAFPEVRSGEPTALLAVSCLFFCFVLFSFQ